MILALEFSTHQRSAAIFESSSDSNALPLVIVAGEEEVQRGISPFVLLDRLFSEAKATPEKITHIYIGLGPGSYTGMRSALSIAQGWRLARPIFIHGLATPWILASQVQSSGFTGRSHTVIDAQREEIYAATFAISKTEIQMLGSIELMKPSQLDFNQEDRIVGPLAQKWFAGAQSLFPEARSMLQIAMNRPDLLIHGDIIEPIYLRPTTFVKAPPARVLPTDS